MLCLYLREPTSPTVFCLTWGTWKFRDLSLTLPDGLSQLRIPLCRYRLTQPTHRTRLPNLPRSMIRHLSGLKPVELPVVPVTPYRFTAWAIQEIHSLSLSRLTTRKECQLKDSMLTEMMMVSSMTMTSIVLKAPIRT